jgi:6-phosphogluconolactonase
MTFPSAPPPIHTWDERRLFVIPGDLPKTLLFCACHFIACARHAIQERSFFAVALSGGSTPQAIFNLISSPPLSSQIDWSKVHLFWSDERAVPPDHPDSNYGMAMQSGFNRLDLLPSHIHRMHAEEKNIEEQAALYEQQIEKVLKGQPFDLVMLGIGEDGHTASLFPNTAVLKEKKHLVAATFVPPKKSWRITLTFPGIQHARCIVLYALGKQKQAIVQRVFSDKNQELPASCVGTSSQKALWVLDTDSAQGFQHGGRD